MLTTAFQKACTDKYVNLGFIRYRNSFARVSGDIVQTFTLVKFHPRPACTVCFAILPLCQATPIDLNIEQYKLDKLFSDEEINYYMGWYVDVKESLSVTMCVQSLINAIDKHIIPLFTKCTDCKTALHEMLKLEERLDSRRKKRLQLYGIPDCADPWFYNTLFDELKYYMALKANNTVFARLYLEHQINYRKKKIEKGNGDSSYDNERLLECQIHLEQLHAQNQIFFDTIVQKNEGRNLELLFSKYPRFEIGRAHV